jgi:osmotically-inducible protein OsmY
MITATTEADRSLGQQIAQELKTDTTMAGVIPTLKITVENSKITLRGTVKSEDEKKKVESAVQRVTGVSSVDDQLVVGTGSAEQGINRSNQ